MISINEAKRLIKRALLANLTTKKQDLAITPLVSGKHGIGKSQMVKSIARDLGGVCITIEGGTLKEGEITGLPYQYKDENGQIRFRFLPYYAVERIQAEEKRLFELSGKAAADETLSGDENRYAQNDLSPEEKIDAMRNGAVRPVILFIDEINRTENSVYKELMNILLTRSVNGYTFPWWVFFVGAMNPSTQNSVYATNEMDPAQLDRFLKIKVGDNTREWLNYGKETGVDPRILAFIKDNMKNLVSAKLGASVATMFFASIVSKARALTPEEIFADDARLTATGDALEALSAAKKVQTCNLMLDYLKENIEFIMLDKERFAIVKQQLTQMVKRMDASTRLLFAQNLTATTTDDGNNLIELLFDVFEKELIQMLDLSDQTRRAIEGK